MWGSHVFLVLSFDFDFGQFVSIGDIVGDNSDVVREAQGRIGESGMPSMEFLNQKE